MKPVKQKGQDYVGLDSRLEVAVDALLYHPRNRRFFQNYYRKGKFRRAFKGLASMMRRKFGPIYDLNMHFTGISHLDAGWLWPVVDTKERAYKTFYKAVEHCDLYPFLTFAETTPQYYQWVKQYDPVLWEKVKEKVREDRIEITGGMWVEPDLNMPSGEALIRQRLYGQLWYLREFGFFPTLASLEDVFGFPWSLPQIFVKSGAEYFWTTKTHWSDANGWPLCYYYWRGIDGSEIFTYNFTFLFDALTNAKRFRKEARYPAAGYERTAIHSNMTNAEIEERFSKVPGDFNHNIAVFYGLGDGGRGPIEPEILIADTFVHAYGGEHCSQHAFFKAQKEEIGDRYLVWDDEKYLEFHRAVTTTQLAVKHWNRRAECWAGAAERLLTLMNLLAPGVVPVDKGHMFEMWRKILFNQFHDILPGTSIPDVYKLAVKEQQDSVAMAQEIVEQCLSRVETTGDEFVVFNPFNWPRSEYLTLAEEGGKTLYRVDDVPPLAVQVVSRAKARVPGEPLDCIREDPGVGGFILENKTLRAIVSGEHGTLTSLVLKATGHDLMTTEGTYQKQGSGLRIFHEEPRTRWKAWNLDKYYALKKIPVRVVEGPAITRTPAGVPRVTTTYQFLNSTATLSFTLRPADEWIHLEVHTDVRDPKVLVKYFIPLALASDAVTCSIPYGVIDRKRMKRTERQKAKWEMNMHKWIDVSDADRGLTILNDNRYAFNATPKGVYLTLTRTAKYPGVSPLYGATRTIPKKKRPKYTDLYPFDYQFALFPHVGTWRDAHVWQLAENFNLPLVTVIPSSRSSGANPIDGASITRSLLTVDAPNVHVGAIKLGEWTGPDFSTLPQAEEWSWDAKHFILRLVELEGRAIKATITFHTHLQVQEVTEVDLLEMHPTKGLLVPGNQLTIELKAWEIKTLRVLLS